MHAGSVDERPDQQGLAHVVEHVTFLGSRKREGLLGTGARSNAYTDFHHTVFHVHAPLANGALPGAPPMLPQARPHPGNGVVGRVRWVAGWTGRFYRPIPPPKPRPDLVFP